MFFLRGYFLWYYDMERDQGMLPFGAIRPGCWINTIPANGLVLFPEASAGCTCSYPVNTTVALQPKKQQRVWALCVQRGDMTPVRHMAVNFGAPGDWRADDGTLWFSYPHPPSSTWYEYGVNFQLGVEFLENHGYFCNNFEGMEVKGTDWPWIFASGCRGLKACSIPLLSGEQGPGTYTVRLYFVEANDIPRGQRVFNVALQGKPVLTKFDIMAEAGGPRIAVIKEFTGIKVQDALRITFESKDKEPGLEASPLINAVEIIREDAPVVASR